MSPLTALQDERLETLRAKMIAELNRDLFRDGTNSVSKRPWYRIGTANVRSYCSTLWRAIKGEQLYDDYD